MSALFRLATLPAHVRSTERDLRAIATYLQEDCNARPLAVSAIEMTWLFPPSSFDTVSEFLAA